MKKEQIVAFGVIVVATISGLFIYKAIDKKLQKNKEEV